MKSREDVLNEVDSYKGLFGIAHIDEFWDWQQRRKKMELILILVCIFLLLSNSGSTHKGRVYTNPDPEEIDYVIPSNDD